MLILIFSSIAYAQPQQTFSSTTGGPIPDDGSTNYWPLAVTGLTPATINTNFGLEKVCIDLTHTWDSDLEVSIVSPDGTEFLLFSGVGGDGDDFTNTCFRKIYPTPIGTGTAPFNGDFKPQGDMGLVNNGQNGNGTWQLKIRDTYAFADAGTVIGWSLRFGPDPAIPFIMPPSNLPIIKINTAGNASIPDDPKIQADIKIVDNGPGQLNSFTDTTYAFRHNIGIETRGSSSGGLPKKNYGFETWDSNGNDKDTSFLGFPAQSDWILHANHIDKSLMRNALSYELARKMGQYASRGKYVEVFVNDQYMGVYVMMEKIKRDTARVRIANLLPTDNAGDELTGGYIIKIDKITGSGGDGFYSIYSQPNDPNFYTFYQYEYPSQTEITQQQKDYIALFIDSFETALKSPNFQDPVNGWRKYASEITFIDYLFLNEMSKNVDGYRISTYLYKEKVTDGNKLKIGPVWDYDIAWFNADYCQGDIDTGWAYNFNYVCGAGVPFWWERMMQDTLFQARVHCRWTELRAPGGVLHTDSIMLFIDSIANWIDTAATRNFEQWPVLGIYTWPEPAPLANTYAGQVNKLKFWINNRMVWLDAQFNNLQPMPIIANLGADTSFCEGNSVTLSPGIFNKYNWNTGQNSPIISVNQSGDYSVTVENKYWCKSNDTVTAIQIPLPYPVFYTDSIGELTIGFSPNNETQDFYTWYFGDGDSSLLVEPIHQYDTTGSYTVTLVVRDSFGCVNTSSVNIIITLPVGVSETVADNILQLYPNPACSILYINLNTTNNSPYTLNVQNAIGQTVNTYSLTQGVNSIDVSSYLTGIYTLQITQTNSSIAIKKFIKQ